MSETVLSIRQEAAQRREIGDQLDALLEMRSTQAAAYGPHFAQLWAAATRAVTGGKLLRPRLLIEIFDALASSPVAEGDRLGPCAAARDSALRIAAAVEMLHFSFLLHDDVIDEDLTRRGVPNLIGILLHQADASHGEVGDAGAGTPTQRRLHWARSSGVLVGDLMLAAAHQVFAREDLPQQGRLRLLDLLDHTVTESVAGEHCDVGLGDGVFASDLSTVLEMTRMKTATYTFELPLRAALILADADPHLEHVFGAIGRHLGVAFQLQDDLLSAFGNSELHGKDRFSDFREGKETALVAYARMTTAWPSLEPLLGRPDFADADGETIQELLSHCGAEEFIRSMVHDQVRAALDILAHEDPVIPPAVAQCVLKLVDALDGRRA